MFAIVKIRMVWSWWWWWGETRKVDDGDGSKYCDIDKDDNDVS